MTGCFWSRLVLFSLCAVLATDKAFLASTAPVLAGKMPTWSKNWRAGFEIIR
jgi:hypothetical protein